MVQGLYQRARHTAVSSTLTEYNTALIYDHWYSAEGSGEIPSRRQDYSYVKAIRADGFVEAPV